MQIAPADACLADLDPDIPGVLQLRNGSVFKCDVLDCPEDERGVCVLVVSHLAWIHGNRLSLFVYLKLSTDFADKTTLNDWMVTTRLTGMVGYLYIRF